MKRVIKSLGALGLVALVGLSAAQERISAPNVILIKNVAAPIDAINPRYEMWDGATTRTVQLIPGAEATDIKFENLKLTPDKYTVIFKVDDAKGVPQVITLNKYETKDPLEILYTKAQIALLQSVGVDVDAQRPLAMTIFRKALQVELAEAEDRVINLQREIEDFDAANPDVVKAITQ